MSAWKFKKYSISARSKVISVISCSPSGWVASSITMGNNMALAMRANGTCSIECPTNYFQFNLSWQYAGKCVIIHTHGSPDGLYNEKNGATPIIISTQQIQKIARNSNIKFVMMTACSTAGNSTGKNVACWLSQKINRRGIVIANKYTVVGGDTQFKAYNSEKGWV